MSHSSGSGRHTQRVGQGGKYLLSTESRSKVRWLYSQLVPFFPRQGYPLSLKLSLAAAAAALTQIYEHVCSLCSCDGVSEYLSLSFSHTLWAFFTYLSLSHAISLTFETNWKVEIDKFICIGFAQKKLDVKNWKKIFYFCHESEWTVKVLDVVRKNSHSTRTTHNNSNNHNIHVTALIVSYCIAHINNNNDNNINEKKFPSWWQRGK